MAAVSPPARPPRLCTGAQVPGVQRKKLGPGAVESLRGEEAFVVRGCLSEAESRSFVEFADRMGWKHQSSRGPKYGEAFRDNDRVQVHSPEIAALLWECGLGRAFEATVREGALGGARVVGLNPNIRLYRYERGQQFGRHFDDSVEVGPGRATAYTVLVYLSGGVVGGETAFYDERGKDLFAVAPEAGMALFHVHGDRCMEHEGAEVLRGTKYVLRSDVVVERG